MVLVLTCLAGCERESSGSLPDEAQAVRAETPPLPAEYALPQGVLDFTLPLVGGDSLRLANLRGQVVVLNFWATWCAPCRREIPYLIELHTDRGEHGFEIVGVSIDEDASTVDFWVDLKDIPYPVVVADAAVRARFGVDRIPVTLFLDEEGRAVKGYPGSPQDLEMIGRDLAALLAHGQAVRPQ